MVYAIYARTTRIIIITRYQIALALRVHAIKTGRYTWKKIENDHLSAAMAT